MCTEVRLWIKNAFAMYTHRNERVSGLNIGPPRTWIRAHWTTGQFKSGPHQNNKVGCAFLMVVVSMLPHAEIGRNDHPEGSSHFICTIKTFK